MAEYKCKCNDEVIDKSGVTIRHIEGEGVIHDVQCEKCEEYMELANPKSGYASLFPSVTHRHGGRPTTKGTRYIIVSFVKKGD